MSVRTPPIRPGGTRSKLVEAALQAAKDSNGKHYKWGGKTTEGFDCSGFVSYVYAKVFPTFTYLDTKNLECGTHFSAVQTPQPGDLIFFGAGVNPYEVKRGNRKEFPAHVGIVLDASSWIGSQSSTGAAVVPMANPWWAARTRTFLKYAGVDE
jgi:cell wall-associated NlpC family hydrolase